MKPKRVKKMTRGRNAYARWRKTLASVNLKFSKLGKCIYISHSRSKYWLDKDFAFVRVFGTIRATRKTGDKGVTVFHIP